MDVLVIEAVPATSASVLAIALQVLFAIVNRCVMLAGDIEDVIRHCTFEYLVQRVEFGRLRSMAEVAGVDDEFWLSGQGIDFVDSRTERAHHVRISGLVEADMGVADLHEMQFSSRRGHILTESSRT